jgi:hypothetical protein
MRGDCPAKKNIPTRVSAITILVAARSVNIDVESLLVGRPLGVGMEVQIVNEHSKY